MTLRAEPQLVRLVYKSRSALPGGSAEMRESVEAVVAAARTRNQASGVSGALIFTHLLFVQALEGPADAVEATFDRICCDLRHTGVEIIEYGPVAERGFGDQPLLHLLPTDGAQTQLDLLDGAELADAVTSTLRLMGALLRAPELAASNARSA